MQVLAVDAPDPDAVVETLAAGLDGAVAVVRDRDDAGSGRTRVELGPEGWSGGGPDATLDGVLDSLAVDHDWALLVGFPDATVPRLAVGGAGDEDAVLTVETGDVDPARVADALADADERESLASLVTDVKRSEAAQYGGALATFTGVVRARDEPGDVRTERLEYERYDEVAAARTAAIRADIEGRADVHAVRLHHRVGAVPAGDDAVYVVVLAGHRESAFSAVEDGIDRLKAEVPIFKREVTVTGAEWAHERERGEE